MLADTAGFGEYFVCSGCEEASGAAKGCAGTLQVADVGSGQRGWPGDVAPETVAPGTIRARTLFGLPADLGEAILKIVMDCHLLSN